MGKLEIYVVLMWFDSKSGKVDSKPMKVESKIRKLDSKSSEPESNLFKVDSKPVFHRNGKK
ncbi:hypothetical protein QF028_005824 [Neobacillus sp. B4I6]|jgi:hypothetical protein|uniref:hypothetical protein n=1 Tax=Neobacillus sp. B4I6 TaxID=3373925 RepID=UPI003D23373A